MQQYIEISKEKDTEHSTIERNMKTTRGLVKIEIDPNLLEHIR